MRTRWAVALVLVLAVPALLAPLARAAAPDDFFGANVQDVFTLTGSASKWDPQLEAMSEGGLQLARIDAHWSEVETAAPTASGGHTYDWSLYDQMVAAMAQHGLRWYPILDAPPSWARVIADNPGSAPAPERFADFAAFAGALAQRYGLNGAFWQSHPELQPLPVEDYEIWNEENSIVFWTPQTGAPEQYAHLFAAARGAIKAVDPTARVIVGGLGLFKPGKQSEPVAFLDQMLAQRPDLVGTIDAVGLHPYEPTVQQVYDQIRLFRRGLDRVAGASVPIDVNEVGWSTTSVSEAQRAANLTALATDLPRSDCNIGVLLPYTWLTAEKDPTDPENWFGIWNLDGTPKLSGQAYLDAVEMMRGLAATAPPTATVRICYPPVPVRTCPPVMPPGPASPAVGSGGAYLALRRPVYFFAHVEPARLPRVRPSRISFSAGGTETVTGLLWHGWGSRTARADAIAHVVRCGVPCAPRRAMRIHVRVWLTGPRLRGGHEVYSCYRVSPIHPRALGALRGCLDARRTRSRRYPAPAR